jgi:hypothetical protein
MALAIIALRFHDEKLFCQHLKNLEMKAISFILLNLLISERKVSAGDYEAAHYDNPYYTENFYDQIQNLYDDVPDLTEFPEGTRVNCIEVR